MPAPRLTDADVRRIVETTARRVIRLLQRRGLLDAVADPLWEREPLLAAGRLTAVDTETLAFALKTPWSDGTTHLLLSPEELIEKLAALVPPPRLNLVRYHGVLAPHAADRSLIVPGPIRRCLAGWGLAGGRRRSRRPVQVRSHCSITSPDHLGTGTPVAVPGPSFAATFRRSNSEAQKLQRRHLDRSRISSEPVLRA